MTNDLALVIIYNHKYDKNIVILEDIYKDRFSNIYHLVPFYTGDKENVIPVYESSYYFQGYIAQGFRDYFKDTYKHYLFIGDDLILNPVVNENNYKEIFNVDDDSNFITELRPLPMPRWDHNRAAVNYNPYKKGVEIKNEIPSVEAARKIIIDKLNIRNDRYSFRDTYFYKKDYRPLYLCYQVFLYLYDKLILHTKLKSSRYTFAASYADIVLVSAKNIRTFIHYCGAFAATDLWVEVAIPTALALTEGKIVLDKDLKMHGQALWTPEEYKVLDGYENNLKKLLDNFPTGRIYIHPVKLSKWDTKLD